MIRRLQLSKHLFVIPQNGCVIQIQRHFVPDQPCQHILALTRIADLDGQALNRPAVSGNRHRLIEFQRTLADGFSIQRIDRNGNIHGVFIGINLYGRFRSAPCQTDDHSRRIDIPSLDRNALPQLKQVTGQPAQLDLHASVRGNDHHRALFAINRQRVVAFFDINRFNHAGNGCADGDLVGELTQQQLIRIDVKARVAVLIVELLIDILRVRFRIFHSRLCGLHIVFKLADLRIQLVILQAHHDIARLNAVANLNQHVSGFSIRFRIDAGLTERLNLARTEHRLLNRFNRRLCGRAFRLNGFILLRSLHHGNDHACRQRANHQHAQQRKNRANPFSARALFSEGLSCAAFLMLHSCRLLCV